MMEMDRQEHLIKIGMMTTRIVTPCDAQLAAIYTGVPVKAKVKYIEMRLLS